MNNYTNLTGREDLLESITTLEKELAAKTGKEVALVAYSPVKYAELSDDAEALDNFKRRKAQYMCVDKDGRDVFMADSGYVLQMAQTDFPKIRFHFTSEF